MKGRGWGALSMDQTTPTRDARLGRQPADHRGRAFTALELLEWGAAGVCRNIDSYLLRTNDGVGTT